VSALCATCPAMTEELNTRIQEETATTSEEKLWNTMPNPLFLGINVLFMKNVSWQTILSRYRTSLYLYQFSKVLWIFSYNYANAYVTTLSVTKYSESTFSAIPYTTYRQGTGKQKCYQQSWKQKVKTVSTCAYVNES